MFCRILYVLTAPPKAIEAARAAASIAQKFGSEIVLLSVFDPSVVPAATLGVPGGMLETTVNSGAFAEETQAAVEHETGKVFQEAGLTFKARRGSRASRGQDHPRRGGREGRSHRNGQSWYWRLRAAAAGQRIRRSAAPCALPGALRALECVKRAPPPPRGYPPILGETWRFALAGPPELGAEGVLYTFLGGELCLSAS